MQISLVEIEKMFKPYWHEFVGNGLSLVAIDSASSKVVGIILSWDGATPDNWGLCRLCNIFCCVVPTMSADNIMVNEFVISITEAKLDALMMEFGKERADRLVRAELLVLAVHKDFGRKGIAGKMTSLS